MSGAFRALGGGRLHARQTGVDALDGLIGLVHLDRDDQFEFVTAPGMLIGGGSSAIWVFFWKSTNKDAAAVQNVSAGEAMEGIVLAIESGASRGLRTLGLWAGIWTAHKLQ